MAKTNKGAGILLVAQDTGKICLVLRSQLVSHEPNTWAGLAGGVEPGESWQKAARREAKEEGHVVGNPSLFLLHTDHHPDSEFVFKNFLAFTATELKLKLNWENESFRWVSYGSWPTPLHSGMKRMLDDKKASATLAKACSARKLPSNMIYKEVRKD